MPEQYTVYLAGELFSAKHLAGNAILAAHLSAVSEGRFRPVLPQDLPQASTLPRAIRDQDLQALIACDAAVFQYDGLELDSGTVVEYLFAKFADIPAVLLRTDFRNGGDQKDGDPWNLMTSFYPRTRAVWLSSMGHYHAALREGLAPAAAADFAVGKIAGHVIEALDEALGLPPVLPQEIGAAVYHWLALMPGFDNLSSVKETIVQLHRRKVAAGLL